MIISSIIKLFLGINECRKGCENLRLVVLNTLKAFASFPGVFSNKKTACFSLFECVDNQPVLDLLWFGNGPEVSSLRLKSFLSMFDCQELSELYGAVEDSLLAALCLVTYIALQVSPTLSCFFDSL